MHSLYRGLTDAAAPLVRAYLSRRLHRGKEEAERLGERLGKASGERPPGPLAWVHAASVGESLSVLSLIRRLLDERERLSVLVTTGTVTSARLMAERLPERAVHQYAPVDCTGYVRRFLDHWRPDLALFVESELWPNLVCETGARGVPLVLLNARMSERSYRRWRLARPLVAPLFRRFALTLAQGEADARRLAQLGFPSVRCVGNLKYAAEPLPVPEDDLARLRREIGDRPVWLAASIHPSEEDAAGEVHRRLKAKWPGLLTLVAPRHPARGAGFARRFRGMGLATAVRSAGEGVTPETDVYLADTMGELGLFYRLAEVAFVGGSFVPHGGQNPLEPARLGCALLFGPQMFNFRAVANELLDAGGAAEVEDAATLAAAVDALLARGTLRAAGAAAAKRVADGKGRVLDAVLLELAPFFDALEPGRGTEGDRRARA